MKGGLRCAKAGKPDHREAEAIVHTFIPCGVRAGAGVYSSRSVLYTGIVY